MPSNSLTPPVWQAAFETMPPDAEQLIALSRSFTEGMGSVQVRGWGVFTVQVTGGDGSRKVHRLL